MLLQTSNTYTRSNTQEGMKEVNRPYMQATLTSKPITAP
jgi:hypothetical protein